MRVCGAMNTSSFTAQYNSSSHSKPSSDSITYEGIYSEHYFYTGVEKEKDISCTCISLETPDPFTKTKEHYIGIFFNSKYDGSNLKDKRPPINIVICLDTSGSMNSTFNRTSQKKKIEIAKESLKTLIQQLQKEDSLSIITFSTKAKTLLNFTKIKNINTNDIYQEIDNIHATGGTNLEKGMKSSTKQFSSEEIDLHYDNRIIYLTDMCPNIGSSDGASLFNLTQENSKKKIYTTFVGIGVDFNSSLTEVRLYLTIFIVSYIFFISRLSLKLMDVIILLLVLMKNLLLL